MGDIVYKRFVDVKIMKICELRSVVDPKDPVLRTMQLMFNTIKKEIKKKYKVNENHDLRIGVSVTFSEPKDWRREIF